MVGCQEMSTALLVDSGRISYYNCFVPCVTVVTLNTTIPTTRRTFTVSSPILALSFFFFTVGTDNKLTRAESYQLPAIEPEREAESILKHFERSIKENQEKSTKLETVDIKTSDLEGIRSTRFVNGNQISGTDQEVPIAFGATSRTAVPRLLASGDDDMHPVEFNLYDNSIRPFPVYSGSVLVMVYDPTSRALIWSNHTENYWTTQDCGIFSVGVDGGVIRALRVNVWTNGLAIDRSRNLLFYGHWNSYGAIHVITPLGQDHRRVAQLTSGSLLSIALDTDRKHIYICQWSSVLRMDYNGRRRRVVVRGAAIQSVFFDTVHQMLYYNDFWRVMKRSIRTRDLTILYDMYLPSWSMTASNDVLYIGNKDGHIIAMNMITNLDTIIGTVKPGHVSVCIIPSMADTCNCKCG